MEIKRIKQFLPFLNDYYIGDTDIIMEKIREKFKKMKAFEKKLGDVRLAYGSIVIPALPYEMDSQ